MASRLRKRSSPTAVLRSHHHDFDGSDTTVATQLFPEGPTHKLRKRRPTACFTLMGFGILTSWIVGLRLFVLGSKRHSHHEHNSPFHVRKYRVNNPSQRTSTTTTSKAKHRLTKFRMAPPSSTGQENSSEAWTWPMIHIVSTRFQQGQGTLVNLARSRLKLLEAVCMPSLLRQTILTDQAAALRDVYRSTKWERDIERYLKRRSKVDPIFLWIIKVDPDLDEAVLNELKEVLAPVKDFALLVGSNNNFGIGTKPGGWRDGQAGQDIIDAYNLGRVQHLDRDERAYGVVRRAHEWREDRVILETRLDSDDGINVQYIAELQTSATRKLIDPQMSSFKGTEDDDQTEEQRQSARWLYWCPDAHIQWTPELDPESPNPGNLAVYRMPHTCTTAGLTLGFAIGTNEVDVPRYGHASLYYEVAVQHNNAGRQNSTQARGGGVDKHDCGLYPSSNCAVFVEDPPIGAFRSRALTSAGMHNIDAQGDFSKQPVSDEYKELTAKLWWELLS
ncbi:hypothetical protein THAOC_31005 [Thalassiosira oceanica]|uniref:Uncharacterized protein n=1 Tax=Thalassiosira oceanica TaxID=159749 RepID=K0RA70_THAOC|nr:hypothetical protein THAOC_31005 [Thalassiosira oceanica]|eukprot:EJK50065.1 hypothetical protein THAOC_31005 [Thalassiosira oceanica]